MGEIIKVNFNNTKIKLPKVEPPLVSRLNVSDIKIVNPNKHFASTKVVVLINGDYLLAFDTPEYILKLPEDFTQTSEENPYKSFILTTVLQNSVSKFSKEQRFNFKFNTTTTCSEYMACSNEQTVNEI